MEFRGQIDDFGPLEPELKKTIRKALKVMNRETQLAVAAAQQALRESGLPHAAYEPDRIGVCFGAGNVSILPEDFADGIAACTNERAEFEFDRWGVLGLPQVDPLWLLKCLPNMPACHLAICNGFRGVNNSITQRDASANLAVGEAAGWIHDGLADMVVTGATGTTILPFGRLHALLDEELAPPCPDSDPATICRPFDRRRTGSVIAEGAAAFVLEDLETALRRGAIIYGEIVSVGSSCVSSGRARRDAALANAMHMALRAGGMTAAQIGHVHAHGSSGKLADVEESRAMAAVFHQQAQFVPVVAAKSHTGNAEAGSGALELAASLLALHHGRLFPVLNYEEPDPECPVAAVTSCDAAAGDAFLNLSVTPHGQASCLLVRKAA